MEGEEKGEEERRRGGENINILDFERLVCPWISKGIT
jgi:hypothetical protein